LQSESAKDSNNVDTQDRPRLSQKDPLRYQQSVEIITTPIKYWIYLSIASALGVLVWAFVGRIPETNTGNGVLTNPFQVVVIPQPGTPGGTYTAIYVKPGDYVRRGDLLAKMRYYNLEDQITQAQQSLQVAQVEFNKQYNTPDFKNLLAQQEQLVKSSATYLALAKSIYKTGSISETTVQSAAQGYEQAFQNQLSTRNQLTTALANIKSLSDQLAQAKIQNQQASIIRSQFEGRALNVYVSSGQQNNPQGNLLQLDTSASLHKKTRSSKPPNISLVAYFNPISAAKLRKGQKVVILPANVKPNTVGNLLGYVESLSEFPMTADEATSIIGSEALANQLVSNGNSMQVIIKLTRNSKFPSGYEWINGSGPPKNLPSQFPRIGVQASASVITDNVPPITIAIPALKGFFGIE